MAALDVVPAGRRIADLLSMARFRYRGETQLHDALTAYLRSRGIDVPDGAREVWLNTTDRIDFLLGRLGIEVKVGGATPDVWRQLARYARHDRIGELLLVTTRARHVVAGPDKLNGKIVTVVVLHGGLR